jgi:F-type H+-transporting ATPase subunit f
MNAIFRRAYSTKTLIPPNVAAATKVSGASKDANITRLVSFYKVSNWIGLD